MLSRDSRSFEEIFRQNRRLEERVRVSEQEVSLKKVEIDHSEKTISSLHNQLQVSNADLQKYIEEKQFLAEKLLRMKNEKDIDAKRYITHACTHSLALLRLSDSLFLVDFDSKWRKSSWRRVRQSWRRSVATNASFRTNKIQLQFSTLRLIAMRDRTRSL